MTLEEIVELLKYRRKRLREEAIMMYDAELERLGREAAAIEAGFWSGSVEGGGIPYWITKAEPEVKPDAVVEDK